MKKSNLLLVLLSLFLIPLVLAIGTNNVILNSPDPGIFTSLTNYTTGFNVSWVDYDVGSPVKADCTLYIQNDSSAGLVATANKFGTTNINESVSTLLYMNHTFDNNNTAQYWTIVCHNSSSTPSNWTPATRVIYQDQVYPLMTINSVSFTNNTFGSSSTINFNVTVTDSVSTQGNGFTCSLKNGTTTLISDTVTNGTATVVSGLVSDGDYSSVTISCSDPALNTNTSGNYVLKVDSTTPVMAFVDPSVTSGSTQTNNWTYINFTLTEQNLDTILLDFDGSTITMDSNNCTGTAPNLVCSTNKTGINDKRNIYYNLTINDSSNNVITSSTKVFSIDNVAPTITTKHNWTISSSIISFIITVTDTTSNVCSATIFNRSEMSTSANIIGTYGTIGASTTNCTGTINPSDIDVDGAFTVQYNATDVLGNSVLSNFTGVKKSLFAGWNLITQSNNVRNISTLCSEISGCTQASFFNNTAKSFTTYSTSTPSVNAGIDLNPGDAVLIYTSTSSTYLGNNYLPLSGVAENISLSDGGWNVMGLTVSSNMSAILSQDNITIGSYIDVVTENYLTCVSSTLCAGTTSSATDIGLELGSAVWALTNDNVTLNRTSILG